MRTPLALALAFLFAAPAFAQRVVILEFEADRGNKLRSQIEKALKKANTVALVPIAKWKTLAAKKKLKGPQAMTPAAVARVARAAEVDAAVEGALGDKFFVRILDNAGQELWSKELPLKKRLLSEDHARKLAKAITAAAKTAPVSTREDAEAPPEKTEPVAATPPQEKPEEQVDPDQPRRPGDPSDEERERRRREEEAAASAANEAREPIVPERDKDLENEGKPKKEKLFRIVRVWLAGATTWRSYCSRPGVLTCKEFESRVPPPAGDTVDFSPLVPYQGGLIHLEVFPLVALTQDKWASGLTLQGHFLGGRSITRVRMVSTIGETPETTVNSTDLGWSALLGYRFPFVFGSETRPLAAYLGPRVGIASRTFTFEVPPPPQPQVPIPDSIRTPFFPQLGLEAAIPLGTNYIRLEASFSLFFNPKPGPNEIVGYGNPEDPSGGGVGVFPDSFSFEAALAGEVWGPFGYRLRFQHMRFHDQFFGQGKKWTRCDDTQCGGSAEEVYSSLFWGLTASF